MRRARDELPFESAAADASRPICGPISRGPCPWVRRIGGLAHGHLRTHAAPRAAGGMSVNAVPSRQPCLCADMGKKGPARGGQRLPRSRTRSARWARGDNRHCRECQRSHVLFAPDSTTMVAAAWRA